MHLDPEADRLALSSSLQGLVKDFDVAQNTAGQEMETSLISIPSPLHRRITLQHDGFFPPPKIAPSVYPTRSVPHDHPDHWTRQEPTSSSPV